MSGSPACAPWLYVGPPIPSRRPEWPVASPWGFASISGPRPQSGRGSSPHQAYGRGEDEKPPRRQDRLARTLGLPRLSKCAVASTSQAIPNPHVAHGSPKARNATWTCPRSSPPPTRITTVRAAAEACVLPVCPGSVSASVTWHSMHPKFFVALIVRHLT